MARSVCFFAITVGTAGGSLSFIAGCPSVPPAPGGGNGDTNREPTASKFVGADGNRVVHNPALARGALDVGEQIINDLPGE